jgi:hypothetical protein
MEPAGPIAYPLNEAAEDRQESRAETREYGKVPSGRVRAGVPGVKRLRYVVDGQGNVVRVD